MSSILRRAVLSAMIATGPFMAQAANINFDVDGLGAVIPSNTPITSQYANLGVLFEGLENGQLVDINAAPDPDVNAEPSSPNVLTNCSDASLSCPGNRADIVRITFASLASQISLFLNTLGSQAVTFNLYAPDDSLLETQTVSSPSGSYVPVVFAATGVSRIDGLQPDDGWAWAMDDLSFSTAPVPLPAPALLLGAGLMGLFAMRRRRTAA